jgi:exodeoxyribonuclease VII large subunit
MPHPLLQSLFDDIERRPLSVTELTAQVRGALESRFASVWVEGEISNFKAHASGHWYFTIKDEGAQLRATCYRGTNRKIRFRPSDGLQVRARGRLSVYEPRGDYELCVEALDPVGAGALRVAFEQMRERLAAEGLFDEDVKRPLPLLPHRVGVVTSPTGAAIRDILNVIARRTRTVHILFAPTRVQGEGAAREIALAVARGAHVRAGRLHHRRARRRVCGRPVGFQRRACGALLSSLFDSHHLCGRPRNGRDHRGFRGGRACGDTLCGCRAGRRARR